VAASSNSQSHPLIAKLESITDLTPGERQALLALPMRVQDVRADQDVVREGDPPLAVLPAAGGLCCPL
jgi:hypothetical protein